MTIKEFVKLAISEDIKEGDHSALACIPKSSYGKAQLLIKENGILAGVNIAEQIFKEFDSSFEFTKLIVKDDITIKMHRIRALLTAGFRS